MDINESTKAKNRDLPSIQTSNLYLDACLRYACILCCVECCFQRPSTPPPQGTQHTPPPQNTQSTPPPQDTQHTPPSQNTQSDDGTSDTDNLVTAADAAAALRILSEDKIRSIGRTSTLIGTKDGPIANQTGATLISKSKVMYLSSKAWSLTTSDGKGLEFTVTLTPRSTWAFNNGPASEDSWTKVTRSGTEIGVSWLVQWYELSGIVLPIPVWPNMRFQVALQWDTTIEVHDAIDKRWEVFATLPDITKKKTTNGPTSSMFLSGRRPVFVTNSTTLDASTRIRREIQATPLLRYADLRYNRVPEVVVYNSITKKYSPISFHQFIARLGQGLVMNMTIAPMASCYRLLYLLSHMRADDALASPTKYVVKRKIIDLSLDDSSDEEKQPSPKKPSAGKGKDSAGGKSVAGAA
ncbi:hypothetical protein B0H14DRAFT_3903186 [Mycena olivaceomarginata]|nr:hypothetical protein B0H14DRAFT_3903186 [Mycena olivaceomarginata]